MQQYALGNWLLGWEWIRTNFASWNSEPSSKYTCKV